MSLTVIARNVVGLLVGLVLFEYRATPRRDERGLSQSAEIAILVGGVAVIAVLVVGFVRTFVLAKLPK